MINIDKNIPIPKPRGSSNYYPWASMEVGDSFLIPTHKHNNVSAATRYAKLRYKHKYSARKEEGGIRVWRIE